MYVPDTLRRMNDREVTKARNKVKTGHVQCDYCENMADYCIPVYNPADNVRDVKGAYAVYNVCPKCSDDGVYMEENFHCTNCGELFILNHSWDVVAVTLDGELYCQACAANQMEPVPFTIVTEALRNRETGFFIRMNAMPGKKELWSGEYSDWDDFPGHTSLDTVAAEIEEACVREGITEIYPLVTQGYQFSCVLGIYA